MRLRLLAPAITFAALAAPAVAQDDFDPATAVEAFLTGAETLGATAATIGEISEADDTVTASDVAMSWSASFTAGEETATFTASVTMASIDVIGLEETDDGYAVEEISIPSIEFEIAVTGADQPFSMALSVSDYALVNAEWEPFPTIVANPAAPISRFAPLVHWAMVQSYEENSIDSITGTIVEGDEEQEISYGPITVGPVENGTLDELSYGEITLTQSTDVPDGTGEVTPTEVTVTYGPITGRNIDVRPLAALLTGIDAGDQPGVVAENITVEKVVVDGGDEFRFSIGQAVIENFTMDASRGPLMAKFDELMIAAVNNEEPDPIAMVETVLDMYGTYGFGLYSIQNIETSGPDFTMRIGDVRAEGLGPDGLDRMAVLDVSVNASDGSGSLGAFELRGFVWPSREGIEASIMQGMAGMEATPEAMLAFLPALGSIAVRDLAVDAANFGALELGNFSLDLGGYIGPVPTSLAMTLQGLSMPAAALQDPNTAMMAQMIGADPIRADGTLSLRWDEDTQRFELAEDFTVENIGRLVTDATVSGIPRTIFEDPSQAQAALATAAVNGLTLRFEDAGLTPFLLGMIGQQAGVPAEEFAAGIASQVEAQLGAITGDASFAGSVGEAVRTFLTDPQSLTVTAAPLNPVPVAQIMGAAMTAPAALPGILGFTISANGQ